MSTFEVSDRLHGDVRIILARVDGGSAAIGVWIECLMWRSANRNAPHRVVGAIAPISFLPLEVAVDALGQTHKALPALLKSRLWTRTTWRGQPGFTMNGEGELWRIKRRTPNVCKRPRIPLAVRDAIYERDGFACLRCGKTNGLSLDHIHPYSLGGSDDTQNLQTLCMSCNSRKGARI